MRTLSSQARARAIMACQPERSMSFAGRCRISHTDPDSPSRSSMSGASYKRGRVRFSTTHPSRTLQNMAILRLSSAGRGASTRATMMSGEMPIPCSSLTECCVGLDLNSHEPVMYGTRVTWMKQQFSLPCSIDTCLIASMKGWLSMSPMVPPISQMTISAWLFSPTE